MKQDSNNQSPALIFSRQPRVLIIEARFYAEIADMQVTGARQMLERHGAAYEIAAVPGALEIPSGISFASKTGRFDAYVALGCVIRGETTHYDIVAGESSRALMDLSLTGLCIGNGILTVENIAQATVRANPSEMDKGGGAAYAALAMYALKEKLEL